METFLSSLSPRNQMPEVNLTYCPYNVHTSETFTIFTLGTCEPNTAWRRNSEVGTPVATRWGCCSVRVECRQAALYKNLQDAEAELEQALGRWGVTDVPLHMCMEVLRRLYRCLWASLLLSSTFPSPFLPALTPN